mmetsp:Transcript_21524/g.43810  ORF Transcript_21524/g.43810 Transcript_21524/m.43810 type:complete len:261 (+) Transcript_21524:89-871(+)|eukprot:CAMPEP_0202841838 /NCGR_PEP_ID=MMETSP1389-20130828/59723_1 /ASSEMBLY_ACC=CAM_ASM_000865 /TAXON_ID=302021 /ORGANISM="Rhodomonas sp., Strain CCMP768" /LENGTH=260 /DNA_ID=CAMNT_0049518707 /DNA_START=86 /DNA_END=868 /DNA_ORIENTATION=+
MSGDNALTQEELKWMSHLLDECRKKDVMPRNRFELAAYAIVCKGDTKKAIARLTKVRKVEADIERNSIDTATASRIVDLICPASNLAAGRDDLGRPMMYTDFAAANPYGFETEYQRDCLLKVTMDFFACLTSTIKEIREGAVMVASGRGMGWKNFSFELHRRNSAITEDGFPIKLKGFIILNPPMIISAMIALSRQFVKKKIRDRIVICSAQDVQSKRVANISLEQLPPHAGGSYTECKDTWVARSLARRAESIKELGPI